VKKTVRRKAIYKLNLPKLVMHLQWKYRRKTSSLELPNKATLLITDVGVLVFEKSEAMQRDFYLDELNI